MQLKERLSPSKETTETNLMSCKTFFLRFRDKDSNEPQIYGLTGTIGGEKRRKFLLDTYGSTCVDMASDKPLMRQIYPAIITAPGYHFQAVGSSCLREVLARRPVLVICDTIDLAHRVSEYLLEHGIGRRVFEKFTSDGKQSLCALANSLLFSNLICND